MIDADLDGALKFFLISGNSRSALESKTDPVKNLYDLYKKEYKKTTKTLIDDTPRLSSFNETLNAIAQQYRQEDKTFTLELNEFADWTNQELNRLRGVDVPDGQNNYEFIRSADRPAFWDGRSSVTKTATVTPTSYDFTSRVASGTSVPVVSSLNILLSQQSIHLQFN